MLSPLQPWEWLALVATLADVALTFYGVAAGRAREGNPLYGRGKRAAHLAAIVAVALHLAIRTALATQAGPIGQGQAWLALAGVRGLAAAWNLSVLLRRRRR